MTSAKTKSNRNNARASTGPKTAAGKARIAKNALRHGLSLPILSDPTLTDHVEALAREIAGTGASTETIERARPIAEAQIDLMRVRRGRYDLLSRAPPPKLEGPEKLATIMTDTLSELAALDRYERRALSRRKFAIRDFDAARYQEKYGTG